MTALVRAGESAERYLKHAGLPHEAPTFARPPPAQLTFDDAADLAPGWFDQRPPTDEDDDMWWSAPDLDVA